MDAASTRALAYGDDSPQGRNTSSANPTTNSTHEPEASWKVREFMASKNAGGDPVTALNVRDETPGSSVAARRSQVNHDMNAALAQFYQSSNSNSNPNPTNGP
ncbi:hypothetical protein F4810DRAFT_706109 [Camillea tinctor]|nr:hypothetical protein F4810DRAFT_706109 [Camillea tinctor]